MDVKRVESAIPGVSFDEEVERFNWPIQVKRWLWHDKYFKGLAAYCRTFSVNGALELGTCTGASAVCLAKYAGSVVTCDLTDWSVADPAIFTGRLAFRKCETASDVLRLDYCKFDVAFVDIDHLGLTERLIHLKLHADGFRGDVFYDDIRANAEMESFWDSVHEPKLELDWHSSGFGIVRYGGGKGN
ncbi:MAG: hypothetical protein WD716_00050 [Fimbriimonadaceae bacterium]